MEADTSKKVQVRLKRIGGQVVGIQRMIDDERYCVDVLVQIAAVRAALDRVGKIVLRSHVETCVAGALDSGSRRERRQKVEELMEVFSRFGHIRTR